MDPRAFVAAVILLLGASSCGPAIAASAEDATVATPELLPFAACLDGLAARARAEGVPPAILDHLLGLASDAAVLAAAQGQPEFIRPIWTYLDLTVTAERVAAGRRKLEEWAPVLEAIERRFGVDRYSLVAFWGVESSYGTVLDDAAIVRPVLRSLATLACGDARRAGYWTSELTSALRILAGGELPAERLTGSWAGALGHTQFMPSVYGRYAIDFDGDGRRDLWASVPDALASTANYLAAMGWRAGEGWGSEAVLTEGFDYALADEVTERSLSEWRRLGATPIRPPPGIAETTPATLIVPAGARGPAFLLLANFRVILRYNTALAYALAVAQLADRLRGEPVSARDWPRGDRPLTESERRELQGHLLARGLALGDVDGRVGPRTRAALRAYQASVGLKPDGYADDDLLQRLRAER